MNQKRTCMITDDEPAAHYVLAAHIRQIPDLELVKQCYNGIEAMTYLREHKVDLMFLDIDMPEITGLELLKALKNPPKTILTTAYSEFALESYDYGVIDYLLKPVSFTRFLTAVDRFFNLYKLAETPEEATSITVKIDGEPHTIQLNELLYTQSLGNYVKLITAHRTYLATITTNELENSLPVQHFMRIHKSHIVALDKIDIWGRDFVQIGNLKMAVGITYRQKLAEKMRDLK